MAQATCDKAAYIRNRGLDKDHHKALVILHLEKFGEATRGDLEALLMEKPKNHVLKGRQNLVVLRIIRVEMD